MRKNNKKNISPVVSLALLLVVAVTSISGLQYWYNNYSSSIFTDAERNNIATIDILDVQGETLYLKSSLDSEEIITFNIYDENSDQLCSVQKIPAKNSSVVLFLTLDENSTIDYSRFDHQIDEYGSLNCTIEGISGRGCRLEGPSDYIEAYVDQNKNLSNSSFSFSIWFNGDITNQDYSSSSRVSLIWRLDDAPRLSINSSKVFDVRLKQDTNGSTVFTDFGGSTILTDDEWHHVVLTYNNLTNISKIYLNGELESQASHNHQHHQIRYSPALPVQESSVLL